VRSKRTRVLEHIRVRQSDVDRRVCRYCIDERTNRMPATSNALRDRALRVALHEFGHYVAARTLGFRTGEVTIQLHFELGGIAHRGGAKIELAHQLDTTTDVIDYLKKRVVILYAGAVAETLNQHGVVDQRYAVQILHTAGQGAEQDHAKARELLHILRSICHPTTDVVDNVTIQSELDALNGDLWLRAVGLVEVNAGTISSLARNLAGRTNRPGVLVRFDALELEGHPSVQRLPRWTIVETPRGTAVSQRDGKDEPPAAGSDRKGTPPARED